jgi:hypothetical protein
VTFGRLTGNTAYCCTLELEPYDGCKFAPMICTLFAAPVPSPASAKIGRIGAAQRQHLLLNDIEISKTRCFARTAQLRSLELNVKGDTN